MVIDCDEFSISIFNISNSQNQIYDFFSYTSLVVSNFSISNLTSENSNYILMAVNCSLNLSYSFISRISNQFLLSYLSQIIIFNTIFFDNFINYETNLAGNGISLQMQSEFQIQNCSFISIYKKNQGPVFINS